MNYYDLYMAVLYTSQRYTYSCKMSSHICNTDINRTALVRGNMSSKP